MAKLGLFNLEPLWPVLDPLEPPQKEKERATELMMCPLQIVPFPPCGSHSISHFICPFLLVRLAATISDTSEQMCAPSAHQEGSPHQAHLCPLPDTSRRTMKECTTKPIEMRGRPADRRGQMGLVSARPFCLCAFPFSPIQSRPARRFDFQPLPL